MKLENNNPDNLARLQKAVNEGRWYTIRDEAAFYADAPVASTIADFNIWGVDFTTGETYRVDGEYSTSWLELHETAIHYNADHDGNFYYVGGRQYPGALRPNWHEVTASMIDAQADAQDAQDRGIEFPAAYEPRYYMTYSTVLGMFALSGNRPVANTIPYV